MKKLLFLAVLSVPIVASAQILSTGTVSNNGTGGIFLDLTPATQSLTFTGFATQFGSAAGSAVNIEVWTRTGSYVGFTTSSAGWTLTQTVSGISAGTATNSAPIVFTNPIALNFGQTTGVYLHSITTGGGIRYFGTGTTSQANYSNADIAMFTDVSRTGAVSFGGTQFTPRAFVGDIIYTPAVPEPATMAALGLGLLAVVRRRRQAK